MNTAELFAHARRHSRFLARCLDSNTLDLNLLADWTARQLSEDDFRHFADWQALRENEDEAGLARQLRILRRHVVAQIIVRDLNGLSGLDEVTQTITRFADFSVNTALDYAYGYYVGLYGTPTGRHSGEAQFLTVVAMGKAGGGELNVSSDIDLIFTYPEGGATNGRRERDNQEFFTKVGQKLIALLNDITPDGQVFRVDMRLRPDGDAGALVWSEAALEQYLITHGREWERYAWCKGRVVTPHKNDIAAIVRPFVFRKYLDYNAYEAMRGLHRQIRAEVGKKGMEDNIKLGAGGIREIEFIAQIFQMIRAGRLKTLQLKGTQETLRQLAVQNIIPAHTADTLLEAYRFLRQLEHRLQYWDDLQTQTLPQDAGQRKLLAESMGYTDYEAFSDGLNAHRAAVTAEFDNILSEPEEQPAARFAALWPEPAEEHIPLLQQAGFEAEDTVRRLHALRQSPRYRSLSPRSQPRFDALMPQIIQAAADTRRPTETLSRLTGFLETVSRRPSYLAFLLEYPNELNRVAELMSQSAWIAAYLQQHPILLDELLSAQLTDNRLDWPQQQTELAAALAACDDAEAKMDTLRHFHHAHTFRLAVQDLSGRWTVEAVSDQLSHLADIILNQTLQHTWRQMPKKHRDEPAFAIIGYGKLGGKELGYTSDLDLVYLFDDPDQEAGQTYARLSNRLTTWLSGSTAAGTLYDIDLRLRPNGDDGFPVHSTAAFDKYQHENAWTWEHQSLTRARFVCGDPDIGRQFEDTRRRILRLRRDPDTLRREILAMREKITAAHPPLPADIKYARGGIVDVEFIVQYLILAHAADCPALMDNTGNIALLETAAEHGLIDPALAGRARRAYRRYRACQHDTKLRDTAVAENDEELAAHYQTVRELWRQVFGEEAGG